MNQITTPDAGRNYRVSLDRIGDISDPSQPLPGDEPEEDHAPFEREAEASAALLLMHFSESLNRVDREALLYLLRPDSMSLNGRGRIANVSPNTIREKALRMRAALRRWNENCTLGKA